MKYTPDNITSLLTNQVFVYGANENFVHGAGAARQALKWGAVYGKVGLQGQTWGIPTKDWQIKTLPIGVIEFYIGRFLAFAETRPDLEFLVTAIGTGLAGYSVKEIASLFMNKIIPSNVALPESFWQYDSDWDGMS
jgi:hypothetical protein